MPLSPRAKKRFLFSGLALLFLLSFLSSWLLISRLNSSGRQIVIRTLQPHTSHPSASQKRSSFTLAIYNIAHGRGPLDGNMGGGNKQARADRLAEIAQWINANDWDVVVLNEVDFDATWSHGVNQAEILAKAAGMPYWVEQRNLDFSLPFFALRFGNAVLSKFPIGHPRIVDFPAYSSIENALAGKKKGLLCTLDLGPDQSVDLFAVHLEHRDEGVRVRSAKVIDALRQGLERPLILAGDFNSSPPEFPNAVQNNKGETALSFLLQTGAYRTQPESPPGPDGLTFSSTKPQLLIDWILTPQGWAFENYKVHQITLSDHRPVSATLKGPDETGGKN